MKALITLILMLSLLNINPAWAQDALTSSFYKLLGRHPCIEPACRKEIHFFDINFDKGVRWYRKHFPPHFLKRHIMRKYGYFMTGEASPYYIFHPLAPKRISDLLPKVKLIALLRNPADRAYSHYWHEVRIKKETLSFEDAIKKEEERLQNEQELMLKDKSYYSFEHQYHTYLSRGIYADQLKAWYDVFSRQQILVLKSEDFFDNPEKIIKKTLRFLGLPEVSLNYDLKRIPQQYPYPKEENKLRPYLVGYYKGHNKRLHELLNANFDRDR